MHSLPSPTSSPFLPTGGTVYTHHPPGPGPHPRQAGNPILVRAQQCPLSPRRAALVCTSLHFARSAPSWAGQPHVQVLRGPLPSPFSEKSRSVCMCLSHVLLQAHFGRGAMCTRAAPWVHTAVPSVPAGSTSASQSPCTQRCPPAPARSSSERVAEDELGQSCRSTGEAGLSVHPPPSCRDM